MTGKTHLAFGIGTSVVIAGCFYPDNFIGGMSLISTCVLGSIFPDIDNPTSMIGNKVKLLSKTINKMFGHRNFIHSPAAVIGLFFLGNWLINKYDFAFYGFPILYGFLSGYIGHILLDIMTRGGIPLFYPFLRKRFKLTFMKSGKGYEGIIAGAIYALVTMTIIVISSIEII